MHKLLTHSSWPLFSDIIYPSADLLIKIIVGIFIVYYLNWKTYKEKIKNNLIDEYISFVETLHNFLSYRFINALLFFWVGLKNTIIKLQNENLIKDLDIISIEKEIERRKNEIESQVPNNIWLNNNANICLYTYKFPFLLGKERYYSKLHEYEKMMITFYIDDEYYENLSNKIFCDDKFIVYLCGVINNIESDNLKSSIIKIDRKASTLIQKFIREDIESNVLPYSKKLDEEINGY